MQMVRGKWVFVGNELFNIGMIPINGIDAVVISCVSCGLENSHCEETHVETLHD